MTAITLTEIIGEPREWAPKGNPERKFNSWRVKADDGEIYEINTKAGNEVKLGTGEFDVTPGEGDFPAKLKRVHQGGSGGFSGGGMPPERQRAIQRQHGQHMALKALELLGYESDGDWVNDQRTIAEWADWFDADVNRVAGVEVGGSGSPSGSGAPAADLSIATQPQKAKTTLLLGQAGVAKDFQRAIVHAIAGNPPTKAGMSRILDVLANEDDQRALPEKVDVLLQMAGLEWGAGLPEPDTQGLPNPDEREDRDTSLDLVTP